MYCNSMYIVLVVTKCVLMALVSQQFSHLTPDLIKVCTEALDVFYQKHRYWVEKKEAAPLDIDATLLPSSYPL